MKSLIEENKLGFDVVTVSSHSRIINVSKIRVHLLVYRDTISLKMLKIVVKMEYSINKMLLYSSCVVVIHISKGFVIFCKKAKCTADIATVNET